MRSSNHLRLRLIEEQARVKHVIVFPTATVPRLQSNPAYVCHDDKTVSETKKISLLTCPWKYKRDILSFGQGLISQDRLVSIYSSAAPVDSLLVSEVDQIWIGAPLPNRATLIVFNALTIAAIDLYVWRARVAATATYEEEGINAIPFVVQAGRSDRSRSC
jgi:hypothetical protein